MTALAPNVITVSAPTPAFGSGALSPIPASAGIRPGGTRMPTRATTERLTVGRGSLSAAEGKAVVRLACLAPPPKRGCPGGGVFEFRPSGAG